MIKRALYFSISLYWSCVATAGEIFLIDNTPVELVDWYYVGNGCPPGSISVTLSSDDSHVEVLFGDYRIATDTTNTLAVSECSLVISLAVPAGVSLGVDGISWNGVVVVSDLVAFHRENYFSGSAGPVLDEWWTTPGFDNFYLEDAPVFVHYGPCNGAPFTIRVDTSATVIGPDGFFSLVSSDFDSKLIYSLNTQSC